RCPRRRPQRIDAAGQVDDLGDVPAFVQDRHPQSIVGDPRGAAIAMTHVEIDGRCSAVRYHRGMTLRLLVLSSIVYAAAAAAQPPDETTPFPPGPGRDTVRRVCSGCHTAETALAQLKSHEDWAKTLDLMVDNGAQASDGEWSQIQKYLDTNYTYIFVNKASAD